MSAHRFHATHDIAMDKDTIKDPGDAGTISVLKSGLCELVTATGETRTLPVPISKGQVIMLVMKTDVGDCTVSVTSGFNADGTTSLVFNDVGDMVRLVAAPISATAFRWRLVAADGVETPTPPLSNVSLDDDSPVTLGTGSDRKIVWDGSSLNVGPASGLWTGCPSEMDPDPYMAVRVFDDFDRGGISATAPLPLWDIITGAGGTNIFRTDVGGGVLNLVSAGTDNDYHAIATPGTPFDLLNAKKLWFEARFRLVEAATNQSSWWFGLTSDLTTGGMQTDAAGPLGTYDGVLIWKTEGLMTVLSETSNAGTQASNSTMGTFVTNTWTRVGFYVDATATTAVVTFYTDLDGTGPLTAFGTTKTLTRAGLVPMYLVGGLKAGPSGNAETLQIDYIKCVQLR